MNLPLRIFEYPSTELDALLARTAAPDPTTEDVVKGILADVKSRGDAALLDSAHRFDAPDLAELRVSDGEFADAQVEPRHADAIRLAAGRIRDFHESQLRALTAGWERTAKGHQWRMDGGTRGQRWIPLNRVGVYVPGGGATYPSSVLMNAIPALVAGVPEVWVSTPARRDGSLSPSVLFALREIGVWNVIKVGGAAAVGAFAFGTATVPRMDKIVGPGNKWVNEAKRQVWGSVGLDGYAGPSEVCVVVDSTANPAFAAADFLTQIEHAPDNVGVLIAIGKQPFQDVLLEIEKQTMAAPRRETLLQAMAGESFACLVSNRIEALELANKFAPEHLSLSIQDPESALDAVPNASCVLLGEWTPESAGDYVAGPCHTLPTSGAARFGSPVNVLDFLKVQSTLHLTQEALDPLLDAIEALSEVEGLPAHGAGASLRRRSESNS